MNDKTLVLWLNTSHLSLSNTKLTHKSTFATFLTSLIELVHIESASCWSELATTTDLQRQGTELRQSIEPVCVSDQEQSVV